MATLTVTIREDIVINGKDRGSEISQSISSITQTLNRVLQVGTTEEDILNFQASRPDAGSLRADKMEYLRITNLSSSATLDLRITDATNVKEYLLQIGAGESFIMFNNEIDVKRYPQSSASDELGDAVSFTDIETIKAKASANASVEIFAASID